MENQSRFDPSRKTVGAIYRDAQFSGEKQIICGDMNYELKKSLVDDLNDTVIQGTKDFDGAPFYITEYIKFDLQMKRALVRRMVKTKYRPYPEADTCVFKAIPYTNATYWCWELPARGSMLNKLACPDLYQADELALYRHWEGMRLEHFGFMKDNEGNWKENPFYRGDILISERDDKPKQIVSTTCIDSPNSLLIS